MRQHSIGLRPWRFVAIMSTAVSMTAAFAHLMEMPSKMRFEPSLYVRLHRSLYPNFGRIAGIAEIVAVASVAGLAWWLQKNRSSDFPVTAAAASCLAISHAVFWTAIHPANKTMASWPLEAIPDEWSYWRDRWEYSHAARAVLETAALGALVHSGLKRDGDKVE